MDGVKHVTHAAKVAALSMHFTKLLGETDNTSWSFDVSQVYAHRPLVHGQSLTAPFTEEEAQLAVSSMNANSAPGPDGLGPGF